MKNLQEDLKEIEYNLDNIIEYSIDLLYSKMNNRNLLIEAERKYQWDKH